MDLNHRRRRRRLRPELELTARQKLCWHHNRRRNPSRILSSKILSRNPSLWTTASGPCSAGMWCFLSIWSLSPPSRTAGNNDGTIGNKYQTETILYTMTTFRFVLSFLISITWICLYRYTSYITGNITGNVTAYTKYYKNWLIGPKKLNPLFFW